MNWQIIAGLARHVLTAGGGALIAAGVLDQSEATMLAEGAGGLMTLIGLALSIWNKWGANKNKPDLGAAKALILVPFLALGLSACGPIPEEVRTDLEQKIAFAQTAVTFGQALAPIYTSRPVCDGTTNLCKEPAWEIALLDTLAAGKELLADARAVLASDLSNEERVALIAAALIKLADNITEALDKFNAPPPEAPAA